MTIDQLERRVKALEAALQEAIEFISDEADMVAGPDGEDIPNAALALASDLSHVLDKSF